MKGPVLYRYTVTGQGEFPIDMLRYDSAYPRQESDAGLINQTLDRLARPTGRASHVEIEGLAEPTVGRWQSFGWTVTDIEKVKP